MEYLSASKIAEIANVTVNMAQKYKSGSNLPRLDKAIKLEDELKIPVRYWIELKEKRIKK